MVFKKNDEYWVSIFANDLLKRNAKNNRSINVAFRLETNICKVEKICNLLHVFLLSNMVENLKAKCCEGYFLYEYSKSYWQIVLIPNMDFFE